MGKGMGEHPPLQFIGDQYFCKLYIFLFMMAGAALPGLSAPMDDEGSFPYPYFFTGFILALILLANLLSRCFVVRVVKEKELTRKNIIEVLNKTTWGKYIWPWSFRVGIMWCIPGTIVTGLGGVNCRIEKNVTNTTTITKVINTCYYDIEGGHANMYKGLAIRLVVVHVLSFVYLLFSNCPVHSVRDRIKEDPVSNTAPQTNANPAATPAASTSGTTAVNTVQVSAAGQTDNKREINTTIQKLEARVKELENRERQIRGINMLPSAPPYSEMGYPNDNNTGAHPDNNLT